MSDGCPVECLPEPCVELVCDVDKPEVCPGEEYTVTATATNCSEGVEDIVIYIDDQSQLFEDVAAGAEVTFEWTFTAPADCEPGAETVQGVQERDPIGHEVVADCFHR